MTATPVVIDSSVAVKWFMPEAGSGKAWRLLESHLTGEHELHAPTLLWLEVLNALRFQGATEKQLTRSASALGGFRLEFAEVDGTLAVESASLAVRYGLTTYDAAFAALALRLDCEVITADRQLAESGACKTRLIE